MFDEKTLAALQANYQPMMAKMPTGVPAAVTPKKKKNFWLDQISTGLGIAGGIGGGILGAAGGAGIGAVPGAAAGGAAGSALGETLENVLAPDKGDWGNVVEEGVLGGIFAGGPIRLLKGAGGAARGLVGGAGKAAGGEAGEQALKTSARGRLASSGNKALASQYGTIGKNVARETNPAQTVAQLADMGIIKPKDAERIAKSITGADGILNQQVMKAVGEAGVVPTRNINSVLKDAITTNGLVDKDAKSVIQVVKAQMKTLEQNGSRPQEVLKVMKNLEKRAANLQGKGGNYRLSTPERVDQANALLRVRDELQEQLYNAAGANKNLPSVLTPELRQQLVTLNPGSKPWQNFVDNTVMQAKDVGQLRQAQAPFVKVGKMIDEADLNSFTFGGRVGNSFGGGTIGSSIANAGVQVFKNPAARTAGRAMRGASTAGNMAMGAPTPLGIARNVGIGGNIASNMINAEQPVQAEGLEDVFNQPEGLGDPYQSAGMLSGFNETPELENGISGPLDPVTREPINPYSKNNLLADIQRDPRNAEKYIAYYQSLEEIFNPVVKQPKLNAEQQKRAIAAQNALNDMGLIEGAISSGKLGGAKNLPGAGTQIGRRILGTENLDAALFNVADNILRARSGAATPEAEVRRFAQSFLPSPLDSQQAKIYKLQRAQRELQGYVNPNSFSETAPSTIEDVLMQQGAYE